MSRLQLGGMQRFKISPASDAMDPRNWAWTRSKPATAKPVPSDVSADPAEAAQDGDTVATTWWHLVVALYHWTTWFFICVMVFSQFLCIIQNKMTTNATYLFGGLSDIAPIVGENDLLYVDRVILCMADGSSYNPLLVSQVLGTDKAELIDSSGTFQSGFRLVARKKNAAIDPGVYPEIKKSCSLIASTITSIFDACTSLGFTNMTRDYARVIGDADSNDVYAIPTSLPVIIMPAWDNAKYSRYAIPTWDGNSCMFRLFGAYADSDVPEAVLRTVNNSVRTARTIEWLKRPNGTWKNGLYEDLTGARWHVEIASTHQSKFNTLARQFDMRKKGEEQDCVNTDVCSYMDYFAHWGPKFQTQDHYFNYDSVYIGNSSGYGVFEFSSKAKRIVSMAYDWETLLSNASVGLLLARWMVAMIALHFGYYRREAAWHSGGIGCLTSAFSFTTLPISLLPKLKMILCAFWSIGCNFEGEQSGLSEAWFAIYPAIVEFALVYFSLLNTVAKITRRRVSDALFAPTIIALCITHYYRVQLARSGWLKSVDGRVATRVLSSELENLKLVDFFTSNVALRMNGNVHELIVFKFVLLAVNLLPLLFTKSLTVTKPILFVGAGVTRIEKALAVRKGNVGGLGRPTLRMELSQLRISSFKRRTSSKSTVDSFESFNKNGEAFLDSYELIRLGYVVFGGKFVMRFDDWDIVSSMALLRKFVHLWNYRVAVWMLKDGEVNRKNSTIKRRVLAHIEPEMCRLDDPRLTSVPFWHISACDIE